MVPIVEPFIASPTSIYTMLLVQNSLSYAYLKFTISFRQILLTVTSYDFVASLYVPYWLNHSRPTWNVLYYVSLSFRGVPKHEFRCNCYLVGCLDQRDIEPVVCSV